MQYKVKELAELTGSTVRMLHHYDQIGLLVPESKSPAGYRLYSYNNLMKLQHILLLKELDFSLQEIKDILDNPQVDKVHMLLQQRKLLLLKKERLDTILNTLNETIKAEKGGREMSEDKIFNGFDIKEIEAYKSKFSEEINNRWGHTKAFKEQESKTSTYSEEDWEVILDKGNVIFKELAEMMDLSYTDPVVQAKVREYQNHITEHFYTCTDEILKGLGEMYLQDERFKRNIDQFSDGLAEFISKVIKHL